MIVRRFRLGLLATSCLCVVLAFACGIGQAATVHDYLSQITEVPAGPGVTIPGPFQQMESMTFDAGHLWVAERFTERTVPGEPTHYRVDEFDGSSDALISQFVTPVSLSLINGGGIAVGHATGTADLYAGASNASREAVVAVFDEGGTLQGEPWNGAGTPAGSFGGEVSDVAVDNSVILTDPDAGDVYVADGDQGVIDVFHPEAEGKEKYVTQLNSETTDEAFEPSRIAIDQADGDLIVTNLVGGNGKDWVVDVFEPAALGEYTLVHKIASTPSGPLDNRIFGVAVDGVSGEIYLIEGFVPAVIDQFSLSGTYLGRIVGTDSPGGGLLDVFSLTVDPESHDVYVADDRNNGKATVGSPAVKVFGPDVTVPDVTSEPPTNVGAGSAVLNGMVNPDKAGAASCQFVWGFTTEFGHTIPCSQTVAEGESSVPVQALLSGLEPDAQYCYRLEASNAGDLNPGEAWQDQCFTSKGPGTHIEAVSSVTAESVTFDAKIDPNGERTTYYFQYGTTSGYGSDSVSPPGDTVGSGKGDVEVSQHVQGLAADTVYHYRAVALSEVESGRVEEFDGPDQTFTTQRAGGALTLPDGRSWEMVSPPGKHGALFYGYEYSARGPLQSSLAGNAISYLASQPTEAEPPGYSNEVSVLSTRGTEGWSSQVIAPPHNEPTGVDVGELGQDYRFFSDNLSRAVMQPFGNFTQLSPEATESTAYLRTDYLNGDVSERCRTDCYQPLVTAANTREGAVFGEETNGKCGPKLVLCGPQFVAGTPDLSHIIVSSPVQLTSTPAITTPVEPGLYEWSEGHLQLVSILPSGEEGSAYLAGTSSEPDIFTAREGVGAPRAISTDGRRLLLVGDGHLYLRDVTSGETIRLDVPQDAPTGAESKEMVYRTASSDDSRVFFLDSGRLTSESSTSGEDLYEYNLNAPAGSRLTDLSVDKNGEEPAEVHEVMGASEDGSFVYFTAAGALTDGASSSGCFVDLEQETCNLYVHHDGATTLIGPAGPEEWVYRVSPDGRWLAFESDRDLTGYDTRDAVSGHLDLEVYLYNGSANKLTCASCNPTGARPDGIEYKGGLIGAGPLGGGRWVAASVPPQTDFAGGQHMLYQPRYLSDSGRLFFDSSDGLVPQDVNGTEDAYEFEPVGVADCSPASATFSGRSDGCIDLISSGTSPEESAFLDASETGGDVFFLTLAKLAPQDYDNALDVYDAHECTSAVPCYPSAPSPPPVCSTGDSCKAAPSPQPSIFGPDAGRP